MKLTITGYNLIAYKTQIAKQLVIMSLTVCQATFLIMTMTQEWFFTFGTHKMLKIKRILLLLGFVWCLPLVFVLYFIRTSTCQCLPRAVTTRSSMGRRQAPQIGIPILSWQRRQYNSF